jgi:outer membrane receptor protein involved in Fe transport
MGEIPKSFHSLLACCLTLLVATVGFSQTAFEVSGGVFDPQGAALPEAIVILRRLDNRTEQTRVANQNGEFRFTRVAAGAYELEAHKPGFQPHIAQLTLANRAPAPLHLVLPLAEVQDEVNVAEPANQVNTNPDENLNALKLDRETLRRMPVLGNDIIAAATAQLDAGSLGAGGATVIVDGLERTGRQKIAAARIQEVRINQNPYSAEFARPGRGRIEVITKPGKPEFHGEFSFSLRDYRLDARNAFARTRPLEQRRNYEAALSGPLGKDTTFLFSAEREEENLQAIVFALTPAGTVRQNVATPNRETEFSLRLDRQLDKHTNFSLNYEHTFDSAANNGVGGFNLPEVASHSMEREHEIHFALRRIISPKLINEFTMRLDLERDATHSLRLEQPRVVVLDAFTGGSGQIDRRSSFNTLQLAETLIWTQGKHFIRGGVNIPNIGRRTLNDRTNFGGTFTFSTLDDYLNRRPFLYAINQGESQLVYWQKNAGLFVQDNVLVRPNFSLGLGLRYDWQNYLADHNNFAPRLSFAYAPGRQRKAVIRGGGGIFYDRADSGPISDRLRFDGRRLRQVFITAPGFPDPFATGGTLAAQPASIVRFAPDLRSPYTLQFNLGVERQLSKSLTATANYIYSRGLKLFRSRDLNAPPPPFLQRPDPNVGVLRQIESSARARSNALELMLRGRLSRYFNGTLQYNLGRAFHDTGGVNALPANNYDLASEWGRADYDERHRFSVLGVVEAGDWFKLGVILTLSAGRPYSLTTGRDDNRDNVANDRPTGVRRNTLPGPGAATLDLRWSREWRWSRDKKKDDGPTLSLNADAFNVLNRTNYAGFVGNQSSPFFGLPVAARPARRMQLTVGFSF